MSTMKIELNLLFTETVKFYIAKTVGLQDWNGVANEYQNYTKCTKC